MITGGLGGLGTIFARDPFENGRTRRSFSRDALLTASAETLSQLSGGSARVLYRQGPGRPAPGQRLFASILQEFGRVDGIIHSAGMTADAFILKTPDEPAHRVLEPKVTGTYNLDAATQDINLDFLVLFSGGAVHGNPGQADYAAANFMDQFAAHRNQLVAANARHGLTLAINWPLWREGGMTIDPQILQALQRSTGMHPMQTQTGLRAFDESLQLQRSQVLVVEGEAGTHSSRVPRRAAGCN